MEVTNGAFQGVSVLIPAHDEADWLPACLDALCASAPLAGPVEVIVVANGCSDNTAERARAAIPSFEARGWVLRVLELAQGSKLGAWNAGEAAARGGVLVYLDADVLVSPPLLSQLQEALAGDAPRYGSGVPRVTTSGDWVTRHYTRFWRTTGFMTHGVPGFGAFAMNRAGRARWGAWPDIISDDTFARLNFRPEERIAVPARYDWPMIEGFAPLVRVRRRQDAGVAEVARLFPELMRNDDPHDRLRPFWRRALADPLGALVFVAVRLTIHAPVLRSANRWVRGR
ncbi:glycosyltransferase family 2 protein [Sulfitobacter sp. KE34]|uniref:Glycosyltransferase family 2 protein n=1 Tax=Sulfitobacter faviae TaxID=1775881 RepID=A0AAX3LUQ6_9RHOB|nr:MULTISPECIES: glycosyltransferase family 2 protein [Sulfitobacter]MDF3349023.1 glycosyltransferase family 2 protein [Sulfitobacter sp. KE12]MDF3352694.1 glycosyltransferase family 2 protein [Sulfitobacter sp. KE27]MDF3356341.1 glycosyltransferase family 2 protein [Sulfitobacter sp. KE33]MDF3360769.1 glycosyltransferase family 2 protein [Sulfitobacter sp. Ks41]MDF3363765.1 glycosyltransferase family 2 protein [Sulfitobacter sp. Ks34]